MGDLVGLDVGEVVGLLVGYDVEGLIVGSVGATSQISLLTFM